MKLKDLKDVLWSTTGQIQWCVVYDWEADKDIAPRCSVEYAIKHYGDITVRRIMSAYEDGQSLLIIEV